MVAYRYRVGEDLVKKKRPRQEERKQINRVGSRGANDQRRISNLGDHRTG